MRKIISLCILLFFPLLAQAGPGPYLKAEGGEVGQNKIFSSTSGYGGRVAAGYLLGKTKWTYGLEAGFLSYPHLSGHNCFFSCSDDLTQGYGFDLLAVVKYTFDSHFLILAKGGAIYSKQKFTNKYAYSSYHYTDTATAPELALGLGYQLTQDLELDLTSSAMATPGGLVNTLFVGLSYSF